MRCEFSRLIRNGLEQYLICSIAKPSNNFCKHQRYCITKEEAINTESSKNCDVKTRKKKTSDKTKTPVVEELDVVENVEYSNVNTEQEIAPTLEETTKTPRFGTVRLVTDRYIVYDFEGNSIFKRGKYNYAIGDKIEI